MSRQRSNTFEHFSNSRSTNIYSNKNRNSLNLKNKNYYTNIYLPTLTPNTIETLNQILEQSPLKKVRRTNHCFFSKYLRVRAIRLCPHCGTLVQVDTFQQNCKNARCPLCKTWFCLRCLTIVKWSEDKETCCILDHNHRKHSCWCVEKGLQYRKNRQILIKDIFIN